MKKWTYHRETISGNFHSAVVYLNIHHQDWDVVSMEVFGNYTVIVYRIPVPFSKA